MQHGANVRRHFLVAFFFLSKPARRKTSGSNRLARRRSGHPGDTSPPLLRGPQIPCSSGVHTSGVTPRRSHFVTVSVTSTLNTSPLTASVAAAISTVWPSFKTVVFVVEKFRYAGAAFR
jgi:hypothetical protein